MRGLLWSIAILLTGPGFASEACDHDANIILGTPKPMPGSDAVHDAVLCNDGYVVGYSAHYKAPLWVAYRLTEESVSPQFERSNDFREDERLLAGSRATLPDFKWSGFDRGHMAPAASMDTTEALERDSYLLSNMTPQDPSFNQGGWRLLEDHVRQLAIDREEIFVYTGAVFEGVNRTIGRGRVGVPSHLFKIVWDPDSEEVFSVLIPNEGFDFDDITDFVVDVNEIESWSGIDFLHELPVDQEREVEKIEFPIWELE